MKILLLVLSCLAAPATAHETASFLNVGVGARALALGGAYTAVAEDANAIYWNPAGLAGVVKREFTVSHAELTQGSRHDFAAYAQTFKSATIAGSLTYLSHQDVDGRDALGHKSGGYRAADAAAGAAWATRTGFADFGVGVKFVHSHIGSAEAQTAAVDAGARRALGPVLIGAAVRGLGPGLKYDAQTNDLPLRLALGGAYMIAGGHLIAAELTNGPRGAGTDVGIGGEYQAVTDFFFRAGYTTISAVADGAGFEAARGLTLGLGFLTARWKIDYATVPMGELGCTHRFTFGARW